MNFHADLAEYIKQRVQKDSLFHVETCPSDSLFKYHENAIYYSL